MTQPILQLCDISKSYKGPKTIQVLDKINLSIASGSSTAIVGESGEGKTTLLHIAGGLESPTSGEVFINGSLLQSSKAPWYRNRVFGFIFQNYYLLEDMTALENVLLPAQIAREEKKRYQTACDLLEEVGLGHRMSLPVKRLSGGEKQRVAIARALVMDPQIIFADEPSGNLDAMHSEMIHQLLIDLVKKKEKTLIVVTHSDTLAQKCDETLFLKKGSFETQETPLATVPTN